MKKHTKVFAVLLSLVMLIGLLPMAALAESEPTIYSCWNNAAKTLYVGYGLNDEDHGRIELFDMNGHSTGQTLPYYDAYFQTDDDDLSFLWNPDDNQVRPYIKTVDFVNHMAPAWDNYRFHCALFYNLTGLTEINNLDYLHVDNATTLSYMFLFCSSLKQLDLRSFNTPILRNLKAMFAGCVKLESVDLSSFDTRNVKNMEDMFNGCSSLKSLDLSNFWVADDTYMGCMFKDCTSLSSLTLGEHFQFIFNTRSYPGDYYVFPDEWEGHHFHEDEQEEDPDDPEYHTPALPDIEETDDYTGYWIKVGGDGTRYTSQELMENYDGSTMAGTWVWEEKAHSLTDASVAVADQTYTGEPLTPTVTVTLGGVTLAEGTDYEIVRYENNTAAGEATVIVKGLGRYEGEATGTFTIFPAGLSGATVTVADQPYSGGEVTPAVTVKIGDKTLIEGTDYTVTYSNNTDVGPAMVTVTGKGNYAGEKIATFNITAKNISGAEVTVADAAYTGDALTPDVTVKLDGVTLTQNTDYILAYYNNVNPSAGFVIVYGIGNYTDSTFGTFNITGEVDPGPGPNPTPISNAVVIVNTQNCDENTEPEVSVVLNGVTLIRGTDYVVTYISNADTGVGTAIITGIGSYTGVTTVTFRLTGADHIHDWTDWSQTTAPTCTQPGEETRNCKICGKTQTQSVAAPGHNWSAWTTETPATEEADGLEYRICSRCNTKETRVIYWFDGEASRQIQFVVSGPMHYTVRMRGVDYDIYQTSTPTIYWYPEQDLTFRVNLYSTWTQGCVVSANGKKLTANDDGSYTIPAGTDRVIVSCDSVDLTPVQQDNVCSYCGNVHPNNLLGFIISIFHNILGFFKNLGK